MIKLPFTETVFHIFIRKLPRRTKVWPFDYLKCGVSRRGINKSSHKKKQSQITTIMEVFSNNPREATKRVCSLSGPATKRVCSPFRSRLEKVVAAKGDFIH